MQETEKLRRSSLVMYYSYDMMNNALPPNYILTQYGIRRITAPTYIYIARLGLHEIPSLKGH